MEKVMLDTQFHMGKLWENLQGEVFEGLKITYR